MYVGNRVYRFLRFCKPQQWHFVPTDQNPADNGTRYIPPADLGDSTWLLGPPELMNDGRSETDQFEV